MSSDANLAGVYAKIKRADEHIDSLKKILKAFGGSNPQRIRSEYDPERNRLSLVFADCKPLPPEVPLLIGEVLYQQRSALDHLVGQLIGHAGATPPSKSGFPIFTTVKGYEARRDSMVRGVPQTAEEMIYDLQPFHRGATAQTDPLWMLQDLNNTDKHRALIVIRAFLGSGIVKIKWQPPINLQAHKPNFIKTWMPIEDGRVLAWFTTDQTETRAEGEVPVQIVFQEIGLTKNEPVIPLLTQLSGYVRGIVDSFASEFQKGA